VVAVAYAAFGRAGLEVLKRLERRSARLVCFTYDHATNAPLLAALHARGLPFTCQRLDAASLRALCPAPDVVVSMHYRDRIPTAALEEARLGGFNLHPSLLPRYRGCFSAPWAIINGETYTGITYHRMNAEFDDGEIILQRELPIRDAETGHSLFNRLIDAGVATFDEALDRVLRGEPTTPQRGEPSYYPRRVPHGGEIDPAWEPERIEAFIRAMTFPGSAPPFLRGPGGEEHPCASWESYLHQAGAR
jgi:methionyl-tRNA formyltransferase